MAKRHADADSTCAKWQKFAREPPAHATHRGGGAQGSAQPTPEPLASMRTDADAESRCDVVDLKKLQPLFEVEVAALETVPAAELGVGDVVYIKHDIDGKMVWYAGQLAKQDGRTTFLINFVDGEVDTLDLAKEEFCRIARAAVLWPHPPETPSEEEESKEESEAVFKVERIIDKKVERGITKYKVRWEGYGKAHDTWEPMDSFIDMSVITMFEHELKSRDCLRAAKQSTSASVESVPSMPKAPVQTSALTSAVRRVGNAMTDYERRRLKNIAIVHKKLESLNLAAGFAAFMREGQNTAPKTTPQPLPPTTVQSNLPQRRSDRLFTQYQPGDLARNKVERQETIDQYPLLPFVSQEDNYVGWLTYCKARWRRQRFERQQRRKRPTPVAESSDGNNDDEVPADSPEEAAMRQESVQQQQRRQQEAEAPIPPGNECIDCGIDCRDRSRNSQGCRNKGRCQKCVNVFNRKKHQQLTGIVCSNLTCRATKTATTWYGLNTARVLCENCYKRARYTTSIK